MPQSVAHCQRPLGSDPDAMLRVHDREGKIRHPHGRERLADEVEITGRVENVQLLSHPRAMQQRGLRGNLVLLFGDVIIRDRGALRDVPIRPMTPAPASIASHSVVFPDDA
jgi:hypothetical protein